MTDANLKWSKLDQLKLDGHVRRAGRRTSAEVRSAILFARSMLKVVGLSEAVRTYYTKHLRLMRGYAEVIAHKEAFDKQNGVAE